MAHKTLVGGTAYEISGGKTLVGGTAYSIKNGKTLVGGTAYEIGFRPEMATITITGSGGNYASVIVDGQVYNSAVTLEVPIGTSIELKMTRTDVGVTSYTQIDEGVYEYQGATLTRITPYTVTTDATVALRTNSVPSPFGTQYGGVITVTTQ